MNKFRGLLALMMTVVLAAPALAQNAGVDLLRSMEEKFQGLKSVSGTFVQTRLDPEFKTKVNMPARFWLLKPNNFRAEFQNAPGQAPEVQLITNQTFYNYIPQLDQLNTYKFRGQSNVNDLNYLLLGFGAKADEVTKVYSVKPLNGQTGVQLTPRNPQEANFKYITMVVDQQSLYPKTFTMMQSDNTELSVSLDLSSLQINPPMSAGDFKPNFPKNAHVVAR